jgi:hypothetical protein
MSIFRVGIHLELRDRKTAISPANKRNPGVSCLEPAPITALTPAREPSTIFCEVLFDAKNPRTVEKKMTTEKRPQLDGLTLANRKSPSGTAVPRIATNGTMRRFFGRNVITRARRPIAKKMLTNLIVKIEVGTSLLANQLIVQ